MKRITLIILTVAAILAGGVSCQKVNDIDKRLTQLEQTVSDLKAQIAAGAVITSVDKTEDGCTFTLSNGQNYKVTNGKDGSDGEAIIADVKIEEDFIVLTLKSGETLRISYQNPLSMVTLNIIPDFSDGSVYSFSDNGSFLLRVAVTPEKYIEKLADKDGLVCKADFRSVITKASPENLDFSVIGEITASFVEEGYMTASFTLSEDEMEKMWEIDYAVSCSIEDADGVHGASASYVPVSWYTRDGSGGSEADSLVICDHLAVKLAGFYWATENISDEDHCKRFNGRRGGPRNNDVYFNQGDGRLAARSWTLDFSKSGKKGKLGYWTLPTREIWQKLIDNCTWTFIKPSGAYEPYYIVEGKKENGEEGNKIILPALGYYQDIEWKDRAHCCYWSRDWDYYLRAFEKSMSVINTSYSDDYYMCIRPVVVRFLD